MGYRIRVVPESCSPWTTSWTIADIALLLAAGTERDWLQAWYTEALIRCRTRYERDRGSTS